MVFRLVLVLFFWSLFGVSHGVASPSRCDSLLKGVSRSLTGMVSRVHNRLNPHKVHIEALLKDLKDREKDWEVHLAAVRELGKLKLQYPFMAQPLVMGGGMIVWWDMETHSPEVSRVLTGIVENRDEPHLLRSAAVKALGSLSPQDPEVAMALVEVLKNGDGSLNWAIIGALGAINPKDPEVIRALGEMLNNEAFEVRLSAVKVLGRIDPQNLEEVVMPFVQALKDREEWPVRYRAAQALARIKPQDPEVSLALIQSLNDEIDLVRSEAVGALEEIKPQDPEALERLRGVLGEEKTLLLTEEERGTLRGLLP